MKLKPPRAAARGPDLHQ